MSDDRESDLLRQRRANFEELVRLGIDPYPRKFERTNTIEDLVATHGERSKEELEGERGRDSHRRAHSGDSQLRQGELPRAVGRRGKDSGVRPAGLAAREGLRRFKLLDFGDYIGVEGKLFRTKTNELTIQPPRSSSW